MVEHSRYRVSPQAAGLQDGVLKNRLGLRNQQELDDAETLLFSDTYEHFFDLQLKRRLTFNLKLLFQIHKYFLEPLYAWAGKIRIVDISKDGVMFASAEHIDAALKDFEIVLKEHLPKPGSPRKQIADDLAFVHSELNAIHPFREGNGRTIRLFLDLLAAEAGYDPIDWGRRTQAAYIRACVDGMARQYSEMSKLIYLGLKKCKSL